MKRYEDIYKVDRPTQNIKNFTVKKRESDLYVPFMSEDRLDLMSNRIYGHPDYWWIILNANNYDIEYDIEYGEILRVPLPLSEVMEEIKGQVDE